MKRTFLTLATLLVCAGAQAQMSTAATIQKYAAKTMPRCPGGSLTVEPVTGVAPANFTVYTATLRSTDQYCGSKKYLLYSPKTQQVLVGQIIPIPKDGRPANVRIAAEASKLLGKQMMANVAPFPLPDGLKSVSIIRQTPYGPFSYNGYLDASEEYLIVASRGKLGTEPADSLRELLNVKSTAVRRGNGAAKVEILELSDFQCPTCAMAHEKIEPIIQKNLGKLSYGRIDLPLFEHHEWAVPAAMAARAIQKVAPTKYWAYVDYVFKHQEEIGKQDFDKFIKDYCQDHDIDWAAVQKIYASKAERQALLEQVSRAFAAGIASTPTFIVNGQVMGFGPEGTYTIESIKSALGISATPAKSGSK